MKLERSPTDAEIAAEAQISRRRAHALRDAARTVTSLDRPLGEEDDASFGDLLPADAPGPEDEVRMSLRAQALRHALDELPERERSVVALRYGIDGGEPRRCARSGAASASRPSASARSSRGARPARPHARAHALRQAA